MGVIEQLIILLNPKSAKYNQGNDSISREKRLGAQEVYAALNTADKEHAIGMKIVRAKNLDDKVAEQWLCDNINLRCINMKIQNPEVVTFIVITMLLNRPLPTQRKRIKSLNRRFGPAAKRAKSQIIRLQAEIDAKHWLSDKTYYIESRLAQIEGVNSSLNAYAEEQSLVSNRCPACNCAGCEHCANGRIAVRMGDAQDLFKEVELPYVQNTFLSMYWSKILFIVTALQIQENEAMRAMRQHMERELNA